jgi:hypothetical protein
MDRKQYREEYLKSDHWKALRTAALERAESRCQVCYSAKLLDVHHRTYRRLGAEMPADVTVLCRRCHELFHASSKLTILAPQKKAKAKKVARLCECGCGRSVRHRFAPGHYQRLEKAARNAQAQRAKKQQVMTERRQEVWDAIVNR